MMRLLGLDMTGGCANFMIFHIDDQSFKHKMKGCNYDHCQQFSCLLITQWKYLC